MTDTGTRVPLIAHWPQGIKKTGRVVEDLVEFSDIMPTLCEVAKTEIPIGYTNDGASLMPIFQDNASARKKDQIYIWYRNQVMVRNQEYSLLAKQDGSEAVLTRYQGSFNGKKLEKGKLTDQEQVLKEQFETTIAGLAKARLSTASEEGRIQGLKNKSNR